MTRLGPNTKFAPPVPPPEIKWDDADHEPPAEDDEKKVVDPWEPVHPNG